MLNNFYERIDVAQPIFCAVELRPANVIGSIKNLALEITHFDSVEVNDPERSNTSGSKV
jgi:hypothetical protein